MKFLSTSLFLTLVFSSTADLAGATYCYDKKYEDKLLICKVGICIDGSISDLSAGCDANSQCTGFWYKDFEKDGCLMDCSDGEGALIPDSRFDYWEKGLYCNAAVTGDPHFKTWSGERFDFHGVCDLVLLQSPRLDIHIRTKKTRSWSYIHSVVVRVEDNTLEVMGGKDENRFWLNKVSGDTSKPISLGQYDVTFNQLNAKSRQFLINLGTDGQIKIKTWNGMVNVSMEGDEFFKESLGLMGSFPYGIKLARDGSTIFEDENLFGQEWQVKSTEPMLFHDVDGPQYPAKCDIPSAAQLRRHLSDSVITKEDAEVACSRVEAEDFDMCVFDVMATNDKDSVGAY